MQRDDFSVIYSGNMVQADLLKSLLEGSGIQAVLEDEFLGRMVPYAVGAVKVVVATSVLIKLAGLSRSLSRTVRHKRPNANFRLFGRICRTLSQCAPRSSLLGCLFLHSRKGAGQIRSTIPILVNNLNNAHLNNAKMVHANLSGAFLSHTDLSGLDLTGANLSTAHIVNAHLYGTELRSANFTNAVIGWSSFSGISLYGIRGLAQVYHEGPSGISIDTLEQTAADLAKDSSDQHAIEIFLEGAGVPEEYIEFFRSRIGQPIQFFSCFISYSTKDQELADRLYADLRQKNIRVWLATEDLKIGDKFRTRINEAIRVHDKLMVILSEYSVRSGWVEEEVEAAFERERRDGTTVLFPIRLDDAVMDSDAAWAASIRRTRHIGDFRKWKDRDEYQKSLARLVRDLQAIEQTKPSV